MNKEWDIDEQVFNLMILEFLRAKGFYKVNNNAFDLLKEIIKTKCVQMMKKSKHFAENN